MDQPQYQQQYQQSPEAMPQQEQQHMQQVAHSFAPSPKVIDRVTFWRARDRESRMDEPKTAWILRTYNTVRK